MINNFFNGNSNGMPQQQNTGNSPANNTMNMMQRFNQFCQQMQQQGKNPQQMVQELLNSGKMSQAQFDQFRQAANNILGTKF